MGTTIGIACSAMIYVISEKIAGGSQYIILLPSIIWYVCIPFFHALWEKIYYKFYENGNDFLYLPTLQEITQEEVITEQNTTNSDIPVDIE